MKRSAHASATPRRMSLLRAARTRGDTGSYAMLCAMSKVRRQHSAAMPRHTQLFAALRINQKNDLLLRTHAHGCRRAYRAAECRRETALRQAAASRRLRAAERARKANYG